MAISHGFTPTRSSTLNADIQAAGQLAMSAVTSMTLSAMPAYKPGRPTEYDYRIRPAVAELLNEAFAIDARDPDADQVGIVKNVYGAFTGRMQVTTFRFAPGAGDPKKMEFDAYVDRTKPNTIFVRSTYFDKVASERVEIILHEYVHLRFPHNPGDGHPGGVKLMFGRGSMGIPFSSASSNPYCYEYYAKYLRTI